MKEALQRALDALGPTPPECCGCQAEWQIAITAIKEALVQPEQDGQCKRCTDGCAACDARKLPEQEPVAWEQFYPEMGKPKLAYLSPTESFENACFTPPQRTWVGLTDIDYAGLPLEQVGLVRWAEAKLKEKNI